MTTLIKNSGNNNHIKPGMTILVVGLGKTGMAAVKFFLQQGARVGIAVAGVQR